VDHHGVGVAGFVGRGGGLEQSPDAASEVALQTAQRFAAGLAVGLLAREVCGGLRVEAALGDREAVQRAVELAVAAAVEAVAVGASRGRGDRRRAGDPRQLGVGREASDVGDLADELGRGQDAAAALGEELRRDVGDEDGELTLERIDRSGQLADAAQSSRAIRTRAVCSARWRRPATRSCQHPAVRTRAGISNPGQRS
jgi:hypothetical protein